MPHTFGKDAARAAAPDAPCREVSCFTSGMRYLLLIRFVSSCCLLLGAALLFFAGAGAPRGLAPLVDAVSPKSAFIIVLAALALILGERDARRARRLRFGLGAGILVLAAITLVQQSLHLYPDLAAWPWALLLSLDAGVPAGAKTFRAENMATTAAVGFALVGVAMMLRERLARPAVLWTVHLLCAVCFMLALTVVMIHVMGVSFVLDGEAPAGREAGWLAATALLLLSLGLYFSVCRSEAARVYYARYEDHKIIGVATFLLLVTAVGAGLAGAGILLRQSYEVSQQTLKQTQASKAILFHDTLIAAQNQALRVARLVSELEGSHLGSLFLGLNDSRTATDGAQKNYELAALEIIERDGSRTVAFGEIRDETARVALREPANTWLVRRGGWLLESHVPITRTGGSAGTLVTHIRLHRVEQLLEQAHGLGQTGALVVCAPRDATSMQCLPSRQNPQHGRVMLQRVGPPLPMARALAGEEGIAVAYDNFGVNVISAYGPVGATGLGMAQKIATAELYAPLRQRLGLVIASVLGLTLAGAALLWRLVRPLTARLLETRAYLQGLTNSVPEAVITTDEGGGIKTCNPATTALFGYLEPELQARKIDALFAPAAAPPEPSEELIDGGGRMRSTGKVALERLGRRKDGSSFPVELTVTPFNLEGKRRFVAVARDVSARQAAEEALHRSEEMFRALVENAPDVIVRIDRAHRRVYANPAFETVTGLARHAVIGKTHEESGMAAMVSLDWYGTVDEVFETGQDKVVDFTLHGPAGPRYLQVRFVPERAREGPVQSVLALGRDVTAAKQAEAVLRESENRLRRITGHVPGMVFQLVSAPGARPTFTYVSDGASALCGLAGETVLADAPRFLNLIFDEDRALFDASMAQSARGLFPWSWEGRIRAGSLGETWVSLRATPTLLLDGGVVWDGIILNVTQTKLNELELRQSRESLRLLTAHREAVREEERKHIAREIHDELGQLLTPLRMEVSAVGMAFGRDNPELDEKVRSMKQVINQTIQTVRQVATSLRPAALDLGLESAIDWLASEFCKRNAVECAVAIPGEIALDEVRATVLFRILQETLTNIARHAGATSVSITLKTSGEEICLKVTDNGRGFDPEEAKQGGSFGLKGIAERVLILGGTMTIDSAPGRGAELAVCIPTADSADRGAQ